MFELIIDKEQTFSYNVNIDVNKYVNDLLNYIV